MGTRPLSRRFFARSAIRVAPELLGCELQVDGSEGRVVIRITEVEAYAGADDPASHAYRGRTARTSVMFGPPGHLYCYFTYGMHYCLNTVCGADGVAAGVLLRAGEVIDGLELARNRRPAARSDVDLARGPARLAQAVGLTIAANGADLCDPNSSIRLVHSRNRVETATMPILSGPRVGVSQAADVPLRFWLAEERTVSVYRRSPRAAPEANPLGTHPSSRENQRRDRHY